MIGEAGVAIIQDRIWRENKTEDKRIVKTFF
jgi:hypothetical protein